MIDFLFTSQSLLLMIAGFVLGVLAVIFGGGLFFSVPFMQWLFPHVSFGAIVGNIKVGSFFRSVGSTVATHRQINYVDNIKLSVVAFIGTIVGVNIIADIDQRWLFPAIIFAIVFALIAPKLATKIHPKSFYIASFFTGIYAGIFGAGIGIILIALLRLKYPDDDQIGFVKIQARFVEWLLVITSLIVHSLHNNLIPFIWLPWGIGSVLGGYVGGRLLGKIRELPGNLQKYVLYAVFVFALAIAGVRFFQAT